MKRFVNPVEIALAPLAMLKRAMEEARYLRRLKRFRSLGMHIGKAVNLPASTTIDESHCFLITIEDYCGFGSQCLILAHDAQMFEFLNATRLGRVVIRESCHIGTRAVILPGVEIGPRTIVGANSVVSHSLPPETVCAGAPARVLCTLDEYLSRHRAALPLAPTFDHATHDIRVITADRREAMIRALADRDGYMVGGPRADVVQRRRGVLAALMRG